MGDDETLHWSPANRSVHSFTASIMWEKSWITTSGSSAHRIVAYSFSSVPTPFMRNSKGHRVQMFCARGNWTPLSASRTDDLPTCEVATIPARNERKRKFSCTCRLIADDHNLRKRDFLMMQHFSHLVDNFQKSTRFDRIEFIAEQVDLTLRGECRRRECHWVTETTIDGNLVAARWCFRRSSWILWLLFSHETSLLQ